MQKQGSQLFGKGSKSEAHGYSRGACSSLSPPRCRVDSLALDTTTFVYTHSLPTYHDALSQFDDMTVDAMAKPVSTRRKIPTHKKVGGLCVTGNPPSPLSPVFLRTPNHRARKSPVQSVLVATPLHPAVLRTSTSTKPHKTDRPSPTPASITSAGLPAPVPPFHTRHERSSSLGSTAPVSPVGSVGSILQISAQSAEKSPTNVRTCGLLPPGSGVRDRSQSVPEVLLSPRLARAKCGPGAPTRSQTLPEIGPGMVSLCHALLRVC